MLGYQCVALADQNNRVYESKYGTYSKKDGFILNEDAKVITLEKLLYSLFHDDIWSLKKGRKMTKEEIEKELGYSIEIDEPIKTGKLSNEQYEELKKDITDAFGNIFGFLL